MGVEQLFSFFRDNFPTFTFTLPLDQFKGTFVAVDLYLEWYTCFAACQSSKANAPGMEYRIHDPNAIDREKVSNEAVQTCIHHLAFLMENGIQPCLGLDGEAHPLKGVHARTKRKKGRESNKQKIENLRKQLKDEDALEPKLDVRKELCRQVGYQVSMTSSDKEKIKKIARGLGIPVYEVKGTGEGEELCAGLVKEGFCSGSVTTDTDSLPFGCPLMICGVDRREKTVKVVALHRILGKLQLTHEQLVDFCIMCGTDFNPRVPGYGPAKSYRLIQEYGTLEKVEAPNWECKSLGDFEEVRKIYKSRTVSELTGLSPDELKAERETKKGVSAEIEELLETLGMNHVTMRFKRLYGLFNEGVGSLNEELNQLIKEEVSNDPSLVEVL